MPLTLAAILRLGMAGMPELQEHIQTMQSFAFSNIFASPQLRSLFVFYKPHRKGADSGYSSLI